MKHFILISFFACFLHVLASAQEKILIYNDVDYDIYMYIHNTPVSPRNETYLLNVFSAKNAEKIQKENQSATLPSYANMVLSYNDAFDSVAIRSYDVYDNRNQPLHKSFHGFLTFDTINGYMHEVFANWAYLLKEFGEIACIFASQTQYNNENAQWIKFNEDNGMERYIRIDMSNQDSLAMYKVVYKPKTSKELQKSMSISEPPIYKTFVYKICNNGQKVFKIAESWFGKKKALSPIIADPLYTEHELVEDDITKLYVEWTLLFFENGKDAVIEKSETLFGNNTKK